jgi:sugar phosphate permease
MSSYEAASLGPDGLAAQAAAAAGQPGAAEVERTYRKVFWRIVPFLMLCYVVAYLDRVNVGFAKLQMSTDLAFSETVFGSAPACSSSATSCSSCRATS